MEVSSTPLDGAPVQRAEDMWDEIYAEGAPVAGKSGVEMYGCGKVTSRTAWALPRQLSLILLRTLLPLPYHPQSVSHLMIPYFKTKVWMAVSCRCCQLLFHPRPITQRLYVTDSRTTPQVHLSENQSLRLCRCPIAACPPLPSLLPLWAFCRWMQVERCLSTCWTRTRTQMLVPVRMYAFRLCTKQTMGFPMH